MAAIKIVMLTSVFGGMFVRKSCLGSWLAYVGRYQIGTQWGGTKKIGDPKEREGQEKSIELYASFVCGKQPDP